jgi:hypothetical protein
MGTAESSQSSELGGIPGLTSQASFHRQSPNVARLIRSENSSKMEYEFPISDVPTSSSQHHHHGGGGGTSNHTIIPGSSNRHSPSHQTTSSSTTQQQINHTGHQLGNNDSIIHSKIHSNQSSNLWFSLTSCFGCRTRGSNSSSMNPLRDKVHAIRIVRASNDLTPAVFDSHYNIITLEQLRECDNNASGNTNSSPNDTSDPASSQNPNPSASAQNGNGSVAAAAAASSSSTPSTKKDSTHRIRKKKKKRAAAAAKATGSDDDDEGSGRT